jgi:uncharacterized protein YjbI with pentapeptide repeats
LRGANLSSANLSSADLSGVIGLLDPIEYIAANFARNADGMLIVYKSFDEHFTPPYHWSVFEGSTIEEKGVNTNRSDDCGSGINIGTYAYVKQYSSNAVWECVIPREAECTIIVPFHTDGKIRVQKVQLVRNLGKL